MVPIAKPCEYVGRPVRQQDDPRCCNDTALGGLSVADAFEPAVTRSGGERDPLTAQTARRNIPQARTFEWICGTCQCFRLVLFNA